MESKVKAVHCKCRLSQDEGKCTCLNAESLISSSANWTGNRKTPLNACLHSNNRLGGDVWHFSLPTFVSISLNINVNKARERAGQPLFVIRKRKISNWQMWKQKERVGPPDWLCAWNKGERGGGREAGMAASRRVNRCRAHDCRSRKERFDTSVSL